MNKNTIVSSFLLGLAVGCSTYFAGVRRGSAEARRELVEKTETPIEQPCWGDILMENYVLDVVDETGFWEVCDSTAFNIYEENTSEWYLAVCLEYAKIYK